jgi:hydrophobic/amphiphilic exporter-1 (mainly G- bacteria), HAE1 family
MNLSELFIRRPTMTTLVMLTILLFGVVAYMSLPVSDLPNVDRAVISVSAGLPGANADTMASSVATPLEKEFSTIAGVELISSASSQGYTSITLQFVLSRNIDAAAQDVQAAIARAVRRLPPQMPTPPVYRKVNPGDQPILFLALTSPTQPMSVLDEYAQTMIAQRISMVDGVAQVAVWGSQKYAVRIELDPNALAAREIGIEEVASVINQYNVNQPLGTLNGPKKSFTVQANGQLLESEKYAPLIVAYRNGQPVRLRDLGTVGDSVENNLQAGWYATREAGQQRSIMLAILRQPGTNTIAVADAVKALLPSFQEKLPASVNLSVARDTSLPIRESANDVQFTLLLTLGLVIMVIFIFLRNISATVIPSLTLPMSIVGTFIVMYMLGYSLDNLSLMALTLSVGFVVDDAIVMLENIVRHMEMGKTRMQAALDGSREIGFTIVSMTLSLAAVFIPVLFMGGIVGRIFREFSVTIGAAVLISGAVSLTLTPMLSSRFLRDPDEKRRHGTGEGSGAKYSWLARGYGAMLLFVMRHRAVTMFVSVAILAGTFYLFMKVPKDFIPAEDRDQFSIRTEAAQDISFDALVEHQLAIAKIVEKDPDVERFLNNCGGNGGSLFVILKPRSQRTRSVDQIIAEMRPKLAVIPGIRSSLTNPPPIPLGSRGSRSLYQLTLQGVDTAELFEHSAEVEQKMREMDSLLDVNSDLQLKNPLLNVVIDRDQAFSLGVTPAQIENALYYAYGTAQVSSIFAPNNDYQVIMELQSKYQSDPTVLSKLYVRSATGKLVPLKAVTKQTEGVGPLSINHTGQLPSVTIAFNIKPDISLGQAMDQVNAMTRATLPASITASFQGTAQEFQKSMGGLYWLLGLAVIVIYVVLGILYESFYHPITILSALPFAGFGALLTLLVFNCSLSVYAFVGIIMLVGLVKKNGIMMVDFALEAQRTEGKNAHDAIHEACLVRFRPIMMTTVAALMAGLPIALGYGAGSESRRPLGLAVVGGLLFSQSLTLFVTPVFFLYMESFRRLVHRALGAKKAVQLAPAAVTET